jgi:hypothetical protein
MAKTKKPNVKKTQRKKIDRTKGKKNQRKKTKKSMYRYSKGGADAAGPSDAAKNNKKTAAKKIQSKIRGNATRKRVSTLKPHLRLLNSYNNILPDELQRKVGFEFKKLVAEDRKRVERERVEYMAPLLIKYPFNISYAALDNPLMDEEKAEALKNISLAKKIYIYESTGHVSFIMDLYDEK